MAEAATREAVEEAAETQLQTIIDWRLSQLLAAGYELTEARRLARRPDVDLHLACSLIERGCDSLTAARILL